MKVLGINYSNTHDSSACLVKDGSVVFAVAEERLSRLKHDGRFPQHAIQACLDYLNIQIDDLDYICFSWPLPQKFYWHDLKCFLSGEFPISYRYFIYSNLYFLSMWRQRGGFKRVVYHFGPTKARVHYVDHHLAHAISAFAFSGFKEATVVVMDGRGAWEATSVWYGHDGRLEHVFTIPWPNSIGLFYAEFTYYLGFAKFSDEWKVMGLAPYGEPGVNLRTFIIPDDEPYWVNAPRLLGKHAEDVSGIEAVLGPRRRPGIELDGRYRDIAFAVQDATEQAMLSVIKMAVEKTGCRNVCLAGGVALNAKANGKIWNSGLVDNLFIQPAAADDGTALGAALYPYLKTEGRLPVVKIRDVYLGPGYTDEEIEKTLIRYKLRYTRLDDPARVGAQLLAEGKIIGWFQGRIEFGPRALGARSILADPRNPEMKDKVNNAVKYREPWRPFAPSILEEAVDAYLENPYESPFMILTFQVKPSKRDEIPAVTHVDGSTRPQTVKRQVNLVFYRLIEEFKKLTGVPVVMNTSFNLRGEPIVCSPTDAIRTFYSSGLDALIIGNYLVEK